MSIYQIRVSLIQIEDERTQIVRSSPTIAQFSTQDEAEAALKAIQEGMEQWQNNKRSESANRKRAISE